MGIFSHSHTPAVTAPAAFELLETGGVLIDVREMDEWLAGHAPGATHIPLSQLGAVDGGFDTSTPMVVICRSGRRSDHAVGEPSQGRLPSTQPRRRHAGLAASGRRRRP